MYKCLLTLIFLIFLDKNNLRGHKLNKHFIDFWESVPCPVNSMPKYQKTSPSQTQLISLCPSLSPFLN